MKKTLSGKVIRIIDNRTAVVNLGSMHGVDSESIFRILGSIEPIVDPETNEVLGRLSVVKSKLKASFVDDRFTVATTRWTIQRFVPSPGSVLSKNLTDSLVGLGRYEKHEVDQGMMTVDQDEVLPWVAQSEEAVRLGDVVEVTVDVPDDKKDEGTSEK